MTEHVFELKRDFIPLMGLLKNIGIAASGGHAGIMVTQGEVMVNGKVELQKRKKLKAGDLVMVEAHQISLVGQKTDKSN